MTQTRTRTPLAGERLVQLPRKGARNVLRRVPRSGTPLYYRYKTLANWKRSGEFSARPDPFEIVSVPPSHITFNSGNRFSYLGDKYADAGLVADGSWDRTDVRFGVESFLGTELTIYRALTQRFVEGNEWEEIDYVQHAFDEIDRYGVAGWRNCESRAEILHRCRRIDELFHDIEANGYRSKREQYAVRDQVPRSNFRRFDFLHDEVVVNVGRDGELLFVGGHHRLSIAKILDLDEIPVRLFVRHTAWQERRDRIAEGASPLPERRNHPDLQDVVG